VPETTETILIEAAADGDIESFGQLCRQYYSAIAAVGYSILGEHQLAEDAAQETFARALVNLKKLKNNNRFGPWLAAICRNVAKDMLAEKSRQISNDDLQKASQDKKVNENNRIIQQAIEQLPVPMKELVVLRYYDGLSYEKISNVLGISKASINGRLTRAKRKMAKYLKKMDLSENRL
jgi:RNA polymerase sigma-70 factor (ECF subfamily)